MGTFYIEQRELKLHTSLAWDLAHHMYTRQLSGPMVVITDKPPGLLAAVSKQWRAVIRQVQRERSSTLKPTRILELTEEAVQMEHTHFAILDEGKELDPDDVLFALRSQLMRLPPECNTLYITHEVSDEDFAILTKLMPAHSLVVKYGKT